jgi:hypothetical protein
VSTRPQVMESSVVLQPVAVEDAGEEVPLDEPQRADELIAGEPVAQGPPSRGGMRCRQVAVRPFRAAIRHALPCVGLLMPFPSRFEPLCGKRASRLRYSFTIRNASNPFSRSI